MATNINRVTLTGNLTADPELRHTPNGTPVARLRLAVNERVKRDGEWTERPNFFDVIVWSAQGENAAKYLAKGRPVAVDGRLRWREWDDTNTGAKRQAVEIVADTVQFLNSAHRDNDEAPQPEPAPADTTPGSHASDDDIPF